MNSSAIFDLAVSTLAQYGLLEKGWKVAWDNGKRRAGACHYGTRTISLSRHILPTAPDAEVRETILHEVAHALTPGHNHDGVWRAKLIEMGGTGARTHSMETPKGRYEVVCANCGVIGHRHQAQGSWKGTVNRPEGFAMYTHRTCHGRLWLRDTKGMGLVLPPQAGPVEVPIVEIFAQVAASMPTPKGPTCTCGCGGSTKGGRYLPGHDARHVSEVFDRWLKSEFDATGAAKLLPTPALQAKLAKRIEAYAAKHYKG
jgi:predicted SprT family Zn-dependent metalloprotease